MREPSPSKSGKYDEIIHLPHPVSKTHPPMPMSDRAAQFSPFAALVGYEECLAEAGRRTEKKRELDDAEKAELDRRLASLLAHRSEGPAVTIEYFLPDEKKAGGSCRRVTGTLAKLLPSERRIILQDGTVIPLDDVMEIGSPLFQQESEL